MGWEGPAGVYGCVETRIAPAPWSKPHRAVAVTPSKYRMYAMFVTAIERSWSTPPRRVRSMYTWTAEGEEKLSVPLVNNQLERRASTASYAVLK
jgi:hypothetical protein